MSWADQNLGVARGSRRMISFIKCFFAGFDFFSDPLVGHWERMRQTTVEPGTILRTIISLGMSLLSMFRYPIEKWGRE